MNGTARGRKGWAILAIVALAFLSLRPACDVLLSHWGGKDGSAHAAAVLAFGGHESNGAPHDVPCCASIEGAKLVKPADSAVPKSDPKNLQPAFFTVRVLAAAATSLRSRLSISVVPPGISSFYERSARILR